MKFKRLIVDSILVLALSVLLCACGGSAQPEAEPTATTSPIGTPAPTPQPEETVEPKVHTIAELYEATEANGIFKLNTVDTDGYGVNAAYLRDGYVVLLLEDYSEQGYESEIGTQHLLGSGKIILFPVLNPEDAISLDIEHFSGSYALLAGGTTLTVSWDGSYTLYDSDLEVVCSETDCGTFLGASDEGDLWFLTEDGSFVLHRDGKQTRICSAEGMRHGSYIGTHSGIAYFDMYNEYYGWTCTAVDPQSQSCSEITLLSDVYDFFNGRLCYTSLDKWYTADISDPLTLTAFTKPYSDESVFGMDENYLIGLEYYYDESSGNYRHNCHIYDMHSGGLCAEKSSSELSAFDVTFHDYDQGVILFEAHDEKLATKGLYLWDIHDLTAETPAKAYDVIDYHTDQDRIDSLIQEIYDQYGVTVYYDQEHLNEYSTNYDLPECSDTALLGYTLIRLQECMAEYPDGYFEEIKGESINSIIFCLCDNHVRTDMYSIDDAVGTVTTIGDALRMTLDVHQWSGLRKIFLHENMHMMDTRLGEEVYKICGKSYVEYWFKALNSPECPSKQSYIWEQTEENLKGIYDIDYENAWYIDWYSKCTMSEDEARIMENGIYSSTAYYYTSPHIDRKSRFVNALLRETFPCVKNSTEEVFWEQRTGIVDLYQEFPDFVS